MVRVPGLPGVGLGVYSLETLFGKSSTYAFVGEPLISKLMAVIGSSSQIV